MPSVASSLNDASQRSLLDVMQQRLLQAEMQKLLLTQQRQQGMDAFNIGMRLQDQQQQERDFEFRQSEATRKTHLDETERAAKQRELTNQRGAQDIFAQGVQQGASREDLLRAAMDGKVPVSMLPKEPAVPKPTLDEKIAERKALRIADKEVDARFKEPKATKATKDNPKAPQGFVTAISNRRGSAGFANAKEAEASITQRWQDWRKNYPGLNVNAVRLALQDIYGERMSGGGTDAIAQAVIAAINADKDDQ